MNISSSEVDYTNVHFTQGLTFTVPAGTILSPGERVIIVKNQAAFEFRNGLNTARIIGEFADGTLKNSGESIHLVAADTSTIVFFHYLDDHPWPESPDGDGYSLVLKGTDPTAPLDWRPSTAINGNPGSSDAIRYPGGDLSSYLLAATPIPIPTADSFYIEVITNLSADDATLEVNFSKDLSTWTPATEAELRSRTNHGDGTASLLFETPIPINDATSFFGKVIIEGL